MAFELWGNAETLDKVHFSCRRLCWKVTKYDMHMSQLRALEWELFERPSEVVFDSNNVHTKTVKYHRYWRLIRVSDNNVRPHSVPIKSVSIKQEQTQNWLASSQKKTTYLHPHFFCSSLEGKSTRKPTNWWGSAKRDVTHPTATVIYNTCHHLFRKRSYLTVRHLAWASWPQQQYGTGHLYSA